MNIQLKTSQLKQCSGTGENVYPITKVDNVYMSDGRTLLQYIQSVMGDGGSNVSVESHFIEGLVVATVTVNGVPYRIVIPNAGVVTEIIPTENGTTTAERVNYYGLPDFNPADFDFDDENKVRTILKTAYLWPDSELIPVGNITDANNRSKTSLRSLKTHIEKSIGNGNLNIRVSQGRGNVQLQYQETISISDNEIYNLIKHLIPKLPEYTFLDDGRLIHLLKDNESVGSFEKTTIPTYLLSIDQNGTLTLSADGTPLSSVQLQNKNYGVAITDGDSNIPPSVMLTQSGEVSAQLPVAETNKFGLAVYDGNGITGNMRPVRIQNGRPYIEPDAIDTTSAVAVEFIRDEYNNTTYYRELTHELFNPKLVYASKADFSESFHFKNPVVFTNLAIDGNKLIIRLKSTACRGWFDVSIETNGITLTDTILYTGDTPGNEVFGLLCPRYCSVKFFRNNSNGENSIAEITFNVANPQNLRVLKSYNVVAQGDIVTIGGANARVTNDYGFTTMTQPNLSVNHREIGPVNNPPAEIRKSHYNDIVLEVGENITYTQLLNIKMIELEQRIRALELLNV